MVEISSGTPSVLWYLDSFRQGQKLVIILENELFQNLDLEQFQQKRSHGEMDLI